jgi:alpha-L-fucosidase
MYEIGKKAFFHFGVNTFTNLEWGDGKESAKIFDPTDVDVRSWIRGVKAAGFKMAILTAKHHDGFCLWPSKYTEHSLKNSPYKDGKGEWHFTHGQKAQPYLKPAVADHVQTYQNIVEDELGK